MKSIRFFLLLFIVLLFDSCYSQNISENIVLVNIGKSDRAKITRELIVLNDLEPKVIAIDIAFGEYHGDLVDNNLRKTLKKCKKLILPSKISSLGTNIKGEEMTMISMTNSSEYSFEHGRYGFISAEMDGNKDYTPKRFLVWQKSSFSNNDVYYHFSVEAAMAFDSLKTVAFLKSNPQKVDVDYGGGRRKFKTFSAKEVLSGKLTRNDIEGKIILVGFLGPGSEDKFLSPFNRNKGKPDMYGVEYLAHVVAQVLESK